MPTCDSVLQEQMKFFLKDGHKSEVLICFAALF